jgi:alpha-galactosidase/6-phospho-beta-glucosidase family protein
MKHFINGNFSTSSGSKKIKLVHFCHGAPGIMSGLARFLNMFPEEGIRIGIPLVIPKGLQQIW